MPNEELKHLKSKFEFASCAANFGLWEWDIKADKIFWSKNIEKLFGMKKGSFGGTVNDFFKIIHPDDLKEVQKSINRSLKDKVKYNIEHRILHKNKNIRWMLESGDILRNKKGKPIKMIGIVQDITDRKKANIELEENQRQMSTLMSNLQGMAYRCKNDKHWTMEFVSEGCKELTGYKQSELLQNKKKSYNDIIHPDDRITVYKNIQKNIKKHLPFEITYRIITKKGIIKSVWERGQAIYQKNNLISIEGFITDITKRIEAEKKVQSAQKTLHQIVMGSSIPTFVIDKEHKVTHWNTACEKLTGWSRKKLINTKDHWKPWYHKKRPVMGDLIIENTKKSQIDKWYPGKFKRSTLIDGAYEASGFFPKLKDKWLFFTAAPLKDQEGNIIGAIETLQDFTDLKEAENKLKSYATQLEKKVSDRTQELEKKNKELNDRLNELERFHKFTIGRELKMIELKKRIKKLEKKKK